MNLQTIREEVRPLLDESIGNYKLTRVDYFKHSRKYIVAIRVNNSVALHASAPSIREVAISLIGQYDELTMSEHNEKVYLK